MKAIEVGFKALEVLGFAVPFESAEADALQKTLRARVSTDPEVISVR